jgi:two-component sensor histidine kinase
MQTGGEGRTAAELSARVAELEAALAQATTRLREADHRINNDLQLITSIFVLQARKLPDGPAREAIRSSLDRVSAVAAAHRRLDVRGDSEQLNAAALVEDLVAEIAAAAHREDVKVRLNLVPTPAPARHAAPLALIVNELVQNALRHAFPDRPGQLSVSLRAAAGGICLTVEDDGVGAAPDAPQGFGSALVGLLTQQLRGEFTLVAGPSGVRAEVRFPQAS